MLKMLLARGWKGFVSRYLTILLVLLAINYIVQNTDQLTGQDEMESIEASDMAAQEENIGMNVAYEVVDDTLNLQFQLQNVDLSLEQMDQDDQMGQGHIHLYIDGEKVSKIFETTYTWEGLEPGHHEVKVELAHNNHEPYGVEETFSINVPATDE
ncbi:hypothetical protein [Caldalkalibacillus salinus]|uniref:hypothetical protein n=1 Tax=Caldalkalibacillus salinus TaxID=2803787 RepID=UPI0019229296|nr:hypothetical protein [Caldalkalibacillus salinus]